MRKRRKQQMQVAPEPQQQAEAPNLEKQVQLLQGALKGVGTLSIAFLPTGDVLAATISGNGSPSALLAAQTALQEVAKDLTRVMQQKIQAASMPAPEEGKE